MALNICSRGAQARRQTSLAAPLFNPRVGSDKSNKRVWHCVPRSAALFGRDFTRHTAAADMLQCALADDFEAVLAALDLVLRWIVLRMCEGNTQALLKVCELARALLDALYEHVRASHLLPA